MIFIYYLYLLYCIHIPTTSNFIGRITAVVFTIARNISADTFGVGAFELVGRAVPVFGKRRAHAQMLVRMVILATIVKSIAKLKVRRELRRRNIMSKISLGVCSSRAENGHSGSEAAAHIARFCTGRCSRRRPPSGGLRSRGRTWSRWR